MRYFFHVTADGLKSPDEEGKDFDTFEAARAEAIENARTVIVDVIERGMQIHANDAIDVADQDGRVHAHLPLQNLIWRRSQNASDNAGPLATAPLADAVRSVADDLLAQCLAVSETALGNVQIMDWHKGQLSIRAQQGFGDAFLEHFCSVTATDSSACAQVLRDHEAYVVPDVGRDEGMRDCAQILETAGVRAVQSTPLVSSHGLLVGVVSTHFDRPLRPTPEQMQTMLLAARRAADEILRLRAELEF